MGFIAVFEQLMVHAQDFETTMQISSRQYWAALTQKIVLCQDKFLFELQKSAT